MSVGGLLHYLDSPARAAKKSEYTGISWAVCYACCKYPLGICRSLEACFIEALQCLYRSKICAGALWKRRKGGRVLPGSVEEAS